LAEVTRCRLLQLLEHHELTVGELCGALQLPQSTASRHLKVLSDGGWVQARREGTSHLYRMSNGSLPDPAHRLWDLVREQLDTSAAAEQDRRRLEEVLRARRTRSRDFFSTGATGWDRLRDELFGSRFDHLALLALLEPGWSVGDLGCGTGRISESLAPWVRSIEAVDGSAAMLTAARARLERFDNVRVRQGDLEALPLGDHKLDAATLFLALHHLPEPAQVLAEAHRVLRPGGRLLVVDMLPHDREEYRQDMGHVWLGFSEEQLTRLLRRAGFGAPRFAPLPVDPEARGPNLFASCAPA
jgi:ArsR family transcriptional regulator